MAGEAAPEVGPALAELYIVPPGMTEHQVARLVVEQDFDDGEDDEDWEDLEEELEPEADASPDPEPAQVAELPAVAAEADASPEEQPAELPLAVNGERPRFVVEDGRLVQAATIPPPADPGWQPLPAPRRARRRPGRR
jgi:hypothetical protein